MKHEGKEISDKYFKMLKLNENSQYCTIATEPWEIIFKIYSENGKFGWFYVDHEIQNETVHLCYWY